MAIIGIRNFAEQTAPQNMSIDLIDTPEKLLNFAKTKSINTIPLDVDKLANELGIKILNVDFADKPQLSGKIYKNSDNKWVIEVNAKHHTNRKRYTIAHEIGHFCIHKSDFEDEIYFRGVDEAAQEVEWQANDFASKILIPETDFITRVSSGKTNIEELASTYGVSSLALRIRAKNLGMSGHGL